jgi:opacity protein-like surface antigen
MVAALALVTLSPGVSHAQARSQGTSSGQSGIAIRGFADAGIAVFSATRSFEAILGRPSGPLFGGGVEVGLTKHVFVSLSASRFRRTGHRVFVFQGQVFPLNEPATITITPLEVNAGYRWRYLKWLAPYAAAGVGWHNYEETSAHSTTGEDVHATFTGYQALLGAEVPIEKWLAVGGEAQFASVPNALGHDASGVSSVYNEHNLGGFSFRVKATLGQ